MSTRPGSGGRAAGGGPASKVCQFKLVLLGESAVGKSSLVLRFVKGQFHEFQESTIGAAFLTQTVCLDEATVKFEIWDTAGQERRGAVLAGCGTTAMRRRYHSLAPMYYRGAQAAVVVYDISNADSFAKAKSWVKELQRQASPNIVIALAGNKADLANKRVVEYEVRWETRVLHPLIDLSLGCVRPPPPHEHVPPLQQWTCGDSLACVARRHRQLLLHFDRYQHLLPLTHGKLLESLQPGGVDFEKLAAEWTKRFAA